MRSAAEVARLSAHRTEYIVALIDRGLLGGIRPASPEGRRGQWRIYSASIRAWLGIRGDREVRRGIGRQR